MIIRLELMLVDISPMVGCIQEMYQNIDDECYRGQSLGLAHECKTSIEGDAGINTAIRFSERLERKTFDT